MNDVLLSVDVFHQEFIPLEPVMAFAESLLKHDIPSLRVQPAWVVNEADDNPYNNETKLLLKLFSDKDIRTNEGNIIFPSGNALKYLSEYFNPPGEIDLSIPCGKVPYTERLDEVSSFGINPNGDVNFCSITIGNLYLEATERYSVDNGYLYLTVKTLDSSVEYEPYERTRAFYQRVGFLPLEVFKTFWNEENPCLFMVKWLGGTRKKEI